MSGWSLRGRLTGWIVALAVLAWGASSLWMYRSAVDEIGALHDAALVETAHAVLAVADREVRRDLQRATERGARQAFGRDARRGRERSRERERDDEEPEHEVELPRIGHDHPEFVYYQVRARDGALAYRSPGAPQAALAAPGARGFSIATVDGAGYRVYSLRAGDDGATIHVAQPLADRARLSRAGALRLALPGLALAAALVLAVGLVVRRVTAPVIRYSASIDARAPGEVAPVADPGLPRELRPVAQAVNRLLARVEEALRHERTLTADAAHELRTPLSALRAQAQVALRARGNAERAEALAALIAGVDRAAALVGAVLTLARLDAQQLDPAAQAPVDLAALAQRVVDELAPAAAGRGVRVATALAEVSIRGDADALAILLRNLLDNAIRHARQTVTLTLEEHAGSIRLVVRDDGPGLAPEQAARVFDRFYRGASETATGTGLGLALVRRVAELHGGSVAVESTAGAGAVFTVRLPTMA